MTTIILITLLIAFTSLLLGFKSINRFSKNRKVIKKKLSIKDWMLYSTNKRKSIDENSRLEIMLKKRNLLKDIRKEYLRIKSSKTNK